MPMPVSIPIKTADEVLNRLRLPTSSSGFDRIFHASTAAKSDKVIGQNYWPPEGVARREVVCEGQELSDLGDSKLKRMWWLRL
ncbi:hypothetical protein PGT21_008404 [Puccinia graminis f. sp. tritici]|uniref:Uncharacterized protein n=1 Tax=Puccinia graminis f. sp. tritici TaxID=56615 RepID=A0A5B0PF91_PUCGR|nr:hypothetical protein PGT21_008404 [Puccinia graminis f. sp. tritici]